MRRHAALVLLIGLASLLASRAGLPQTPPSADELTSYTGLHAAAARGDAAALRRLLAAGADPAARDGRGRTPLHVAAFGAHAGALTALVAGGADPNALEAQRYDVVTIAAVRGDVATLRLVLQLGASPRNVTSPYDGTALIAAAHLGHVDVVRTLVDAGAPLDHVNNLGWTALLEAVILGDGGPRHLAVVRILVDARARVDLADRQGLTPLAHARARGYAEMMRILEGALRS
jgi:ankyrin repeat protein